MCAENNSTGFDGESYKKKVSSSSKTGLVYDDIYLEHKTGAEHPENPQRLVAILQRLKEKQLYPKLVLLPPLPEVSEWIETVHTAKYIERAKTDYSQGLRYLDSENVPISPKSYEVAVAAVGGVLAAVDAVVDGKVEIGHNGIFDFGVEGTDF